MSNLQVTITYATLTKNYDTFGKMENFVRLRLINGSNITGEYKTKIVSGEKDKNISWNETIALPVKAGSNAVIEFAVLD
jgi:Ca2+-dependent lipid-binding protein